MSTPNNGSVGTAYSLQAAKEICKELRKNNPDRKCHYKKMPGSTNQYWVWISKKTLADKTSSEGQ